MEPNFIPLLSSDRDVAQSTVRVVAISDTHSLTHLIPASSVPEGDILVHCGDFTQKGTTEEVAAFDAWLGTLPHPTKLVICGNHEVGPFVNFDARKADEQLTNATYVDNTMVEVGGVRFFGIPWKRQFSAKLPAVGEGGIDVLFAHEPPQGILDGGYGCDVLLELASGRNFNAPAKSGGEGGGGDGDGGKGEAGGVSCEKCSNKCQVMLFGHIHEEHGVVHDEERGITFVNCAVANKGMRAKSVDHSIIYFDIAPRTAPVRDDVVEGSTDDGVKAT